MARDSKALRVLTVHGELVRFFLIKPHSLVILQDLSDQKWTVEWDSANALRRSDIAADTLKPGDQVIVAGYPTLEKYRLHMVSITRPADKWEWHRREDLPPAA